MLQAWANSSCSHGAYAIGSAPGGRPHLCWEVLDAGAAAAACGGMHLEVSYLGDGRAGALRVEGPAWRDAWGRASKIGVTTRLVQPFPLLH